MPSSFADRMEGDATTSLPACNKCRHAIPFTLSCKAFQRIPKEILSARHDHKTPFPGDGGIMFEPREGSG